VFFFFVCWSCVPVLKLSSLVSAQQALFSGRF
jgi:hypothetical protein